MRPSCAPARSPPSTADPPPTSAGPPTTSATWQPCSPRARCAARSPGPARHRAEPEVRITVNVNGAEYSRVIEPRLLLIHFIRDDLGLTGSHWGCDTSNCGACVVWLDETPVKSCTVLAVMADGRRVRTVEGLERAGALDPVQEGFARCHGLQCGFCTPGMMLTARWLLDHNPDPSRTEIRDGSGLWSSSQRAVSIMPGVQNPHCSPWQRANPSWTGSSAPARSRPSTVRTRRPSAMTASTVQDLTGVSSSQTTQAPQLEVSQPQCEPVRPRSSRMK